MKYQYRLKTDAVTKTIYNRADNAYKEDMIEDMCILVPVTVNTKPHCCIIKRKSGLQTSF